MKVRLSPLLVVLSMSSAYQGCAETSTVSLSPFTFSRYRDLIRQPKLLAVETKMDFALESETVNSVTIFVN